MKLTVIVMAGSLIAVAALPPSEAAAQERVERFAPAAQEAHRPPAELGPRLQAYVSAESTQTMAGMMAGGLVGLAVGAGAGYLLYKDSTAGCDDGICGWVPPMLIGGATGLLLGGWIGYRIAVGPER